MSHEIINCECGKTFEENEFMKHFKNCQTLINKYKDFDYIITNLLKSYINNKNSLIIIRFLFKRFMSLLNYKLNTNSFNLNLFGLKKKYISKITIMI